MKIYNTYILITAIVLLLTTTILVGTGQNAIDVYFTIYLLEALIITELFVYFNLKARRGLSFISAVFFAGFLLIVFLKAIKIIF